jgi:hypothetical protein
VNACGCLSCRFGCPQHCERATGEEKAAKVAAWKKQQAETARFVRAVLTAGDKESKQ